MKLAVLGSPISHSRSPQLQQCFADSAGMTDFSYERIETGREILKTRLMTLIRDGYDGFNCTMPLKTDMALLTEQYGGTLSEEAMLLQSVNTVAIRENGRICAVTTDGGGILMTLYRAFGQNGSLPNQNGGSIGQTDSRSALCGCRVLLLGAGGAARSIALSLVLAGCDVTIVNRTLANGMSLCNMLSQTGGGRYRCLTFDEMESVIPHDDVLINATSLGMTGQQEFASLKFVSLCKPSCVVVDAVYQPLTTALMREAENRRLMVMSGLWMLVYQGALSFCHWTGKMPDEHTCETVYRQICRDIS